MHTLTRRYCFPIRYVYLSKTQLYLADKRGGNIVKKAEEKRRSLRSNRFYSQRTQTTRKRPRPPHSATSKNNKPDHKERQTPNTHRNNGGKTHNPTNRDQQPNSTALNRKRGASANNASTSAIIHTNATTTTNSTANTTSLLTRTTRNCALQTMARLQNPRPKRRNRLFPVQRNRKNLPSRRLETQPRVHIQRRNPKKRCTLKNLAGKRAADNRRKSIRRRPCHRLTRLFHISSCFLAANKQGFYTAKHSISYVLRH